MKKLRSLEDKLREEVLQEIALELGVEVEKLQPWIDYDPIALKFMVLAREMKECKDK